MPQPLFAPGKDSVPIVQEAGWAPWLAWTGAENLPPTGIQSLDRPARSQSLYRLSYRAHCIYSRIQLLRKMIIWMANYPNRFWPSGKYFLAVFVLFTSFLA